MGDGWQLLQFDQLAENVTDRVADPSAAGVARYVGLEHLDPGSLRIRRWGSPTDVQATKLRFKAGDVVFGKRRVYQRKLGVATFEGICSAHAMVLRAKPDYVIPAFLPLLMQSDEFMERALRISVGSLSPTISWRTLADETFDVPPMDEQARAVELTDRVGLAIDATERTAAAATGVTNALLVSWLETSDPPANRLGSLLAESPRNGFSAPEVSKPTGRWVLSLSAIGPDGYRRGALKAVEPSAELERATVRTGDLLMTRSNTLELVGLVGIFDEDRDDVSWPDTIIRLRPDESQILPTYLELFLRSPSGRQQIQSIAAGTSASMKKINAKTLSSIQVPVPTIDAQRDITSQVLEARNATEAAAQRADALIELRRLVVVAATKHAVTGP